jgi:hypothetical protein
MEGRAVRHNYEMGLPKDYPSQIWFNLVQRFQKRRLLEIDQELPVAAKFVNGSEQNV